jgi:hypothetical protein
MCIFQPHFLNVTLFFKVTVLFCMPKQQCKRVPASHRDLVLLVYMEFLFCVGHSSRWVICIPLMTNDIKQFSGPTAIFILSFLKCQLTSSARFKTWVACFVFSLIFLFFSAVLGFELRASCLLGRYSHTWATPPTLSLIFLIFCIQHISYVIFLPIL